MKCLIVFSALMAIGLAEPNVVPEIHAKEEILTPLVYNRLGRVGGILDTSAVVAAKSDNSIALINEKDTLAKEAAKHYATATYSTSILPAFSAYTAASPYISAYNFPGFAYGRYNSYSGISPLISTYTGYPGYPNIINYGPGAPIGWDGRVVDTPEVNAAKIAHFAAHAEARARLGQYNYAYAAPSVAVC